MPSQGETCRGPHRNVSLALLHSRGQQSQCGLQEGHRSATLTSRGSLDTAGPQAGRFHRRGALPSLSTRRCRATRSPAITQSSASAASANCSQTGMAAPLQTCVLLTAAPAASAGH